MVEVRAEEQAVNGLIVNPRLIDEQAKFKEIFDYDIKFKNVSDRKIEIYSIVNDMSDEGLVEEYNGPGSADRTNSLASWINFKRGVIEIDPGEEVTVPLNITINDYAVPGKQYAQIVFPYGRNRVVAKERMEKEVFAKIMININVQDNIIEKAQIKRFLTSKKIFTSLPISFILDINNFGNRDIKPEGYIYVYDRRDREVAKIKANPGDIEIVPEAEIDLMPVWENDVKFGKYKAKLELEYGQKDIRDLQDTVFFWVMPLKWLIAIGSGLFFIVVLMTFVIFRRTYNHYHHNETLGQQEIQVEEKSHVIDLKN